MFNIFKRNKICAVCQVSSENKKIVGYDPTNRGKLKDCGQREYLCLTHFASKWTNELQKYESVAICYLPSNWNSYSYIALDHASEWAITNEEITKLSTLADQYNQKKCDYCKETGHFVMFNIFYEQTHYNEELPEIPKVLCHAHFAQKIIHEIEFRNLRLDEITNPYGERGVYMSGEY